MSWIVGSSAARNLCGSRDQVRSMSSRSSPQFAAQLADVLLDPTDHDLDLSGRMASDPGFSGVTIFEYPRLRLTPCLLWLVLGT